MRYFFGISVFILLLVTYSPTYAYESRTWTDSSGQYKVEAVLESINGDNIVIKKSDGKFLNMSLSKLSAKDQKYVAGLKSDNPFEGGTDEPEDISTARSNNTAGQSVKSKTVNLRAASTITGLGDTEWSCPPDPAPLKKIEGRVRGISFPIGNLPMGVRAEHTGMFFNSETGKVFVSAYLVSVRNNESASYTKIFTGDITTGKYKTNQFSLHLTPFGVSPDGTKVLLRRGSWEFGSNFGKRKYLLVAKIADSGLEPLVAYEPFAQVGKPNDLHNTEGDVEWAGWVDNEHAMLLSGHSHLILMNVITGKALWNRQTDSGTTIKISRGGKYALIADSKGCTMIDSKTGDAVGKLAKLSSAVGMKFDFSMNGKMIASCSNEGVLLWDATKGTALDPFYIENAGTFQSLFWCDNRYLLVGDRLVDINLLAAIWTYSGIPFNKGESFGGYIWYSPMRFNKDPFVMGVELPHQKVLKLTSGANDANLFSIRPGMSVALRIDSSIQKNRDEITNAIIGKLKANGLEISPNAPISVVCKVSKEKQETTSYGVGFGMISRGGTDVTYTPEKYSIDFQQNNKSLWGKVNITRPPHNISIEQIQNSSLQEVVNREMAKNEYRSWFVDLNIPNKIPRNDLGMSMLTENGVEDR